MKRLVQILAAISLFILCAFACTSCADQTEDDLSYGSEFILNVPKSDGVVLSLLQGNVELVVPDGALSSSVVFTAKQCENQNECRFLLKMVKIEPLVAFKKPVMIRMKCNGCLSNGYILPKDCIPVIKFWETEEDLMLGVDPTCVTCIRDSEGATLIFSVMNTGIFAVGNPDLLEPVE